MFEASGKKYDVVIKNYKCRKDGEYYIVYFSEVGDYFAANETCVEVLDFIFKYRVGDIIEYLESIYGCLSSEQEQTIIDFLDKLAIIGVLRCL